jgi:glycosyltransferase involved in cell wall biosynthesis
MRIVIDATNIGGSGGTTHLLEILERYNLPYLVTIIAQKKVLNQLADYDFLTKVSHYLLEKTLIHRLFFQLFIIDKYIPKNAIVYSVSGDFLGKHKPVVAMSQNMLLYERDIWKEVKQPKECLKWWVNYHKQKYCFKNSDGIIFISNYARNCVLNQLDLKGKQITVIHHGISPRFANGIGKNKPISEYSLLDPFKLVYVSTIHVYKHQWNVVKAIGSLRAKGFPVILNLVGEVIFKPAGKKLKNTIQIIDPRNEFIYYHGKLPYLEIDKSYKDSDGIIFASTCENMPNILLESMASGKPIACSNKQPMPEFLKENGFYFNSYDISSIEKAIEKLILNPKICEDMAQKNVIESRQYSWVTTSNETFEFIENVYKAYHKVEK